MLKRFQYIEPPSTSPIISSRTIRLSMTPRPPALLKAILPLLRHTQAPAHSRPIDSNPNPILHINLVHLCASRILIDHTTPLHDVAPTVLYSSLVLNSCSNSSVHTASPSFAVCLIELLQHALSRQVQLRILEVQALLAKWAGLRWTERIAGGTDASAPVWVQAVADVARDLVRRIVDGRWYADLFWRTRDVLDWRFGKGAVQLWWQWWFEASDPEWQFRRRREKQWECKKCPDHFYGCN